MDYFNTSLKASIVQIIAVLVVFSFPFSESYAKAGCCSHHGGVSGCDSTTGRQLCKDGTTSPSCPCSGNVMKPASKPAKSVPATPTTSMPATTAPATVATPASNAKTKGCCSRHGGVGKCNTAKGYLMCKDGTQSTTCKCP